MPVQPSQEPHPDVSNDRRSPSREWRAAMLLFLFLNCVYLLTSTGRARSIDEIDPVMQSESILLRHSTAIPQAVNSGIYFGKFDKHGVARSAWPAGHSIMVLPWSALGHYGLARAAGIPRSIADLAFSAVTCWSSATYAALAVAMSFLIFVKLTNSLRTAMLCSLLLAFATPLFVYSGWLYTEPATTALFAAAALLLFGTGAQASTARAVAGAALLGFSIHVRPANMVTVLVFIAAAMVMDRSAAKNGGGHRTTAILVAVIAVSGSLYLVRNYAYFGNALDFGVPATAENGKDLESWHNPFWRGVVGFLFSPGKSVLLFCPPMILGVLGLPRLWRRNRALALLAGASPIANLTLYSFRTQWEGSYCYGPRYLLPSLVLLCFPIAALMNEPPRWLRPVLWCTAIVGFVVQVLGLSVNVLEDMVRHHYYNANWDYQMGYSPIPGQIELIWKYLHGEPAGVGLGWDRWFVLLRAAGASASLLTGIVAIFLAGAVVFGGLLWRTVKVAE